MYFNTIDITNFHGLLLAILFLSPNIDYIYLFSKQNLPDSDANRSGEYLLLFILILNSVSLLLGKKTSTLYFFSTFAVFLKSHTLKLFLSLQ